MQHDSASDDDEPRMSDGEHDEDVIVEGAENAGGAQIEYTELPRDEDAEEKGERADGDDDSTLVCAHGDSVYAVDCVEMPYAISAHKRFLIASGGGDDVVMLSELIVEAEKQVNESENTKATTSVVYTSEPLGDSISAVAFDASRTLLAAGTMHGVIALYDISSLQATAVTHSPDNAPQNVSSVHGEGRVQRIAKLEECADAIEWVQWHPRGAVVLAGCADGTAWMWNVSAKTLTYAAELGNPNSGGPRSVMLMASFAGGHADAITAGGFTHAGKKIVTASSDGTLALWDPRGAAVLSRLSLAAAGEKRGVRVQSMAIHPSENLALVGVSDGSVKLVSLGSATDDSTTLRVLAHMQHGTDPRGKVTVPTNGDGDDSGGDDETMGSAEEDEMPAVESVLLSAERPLVGVSGGAEGDIVIWDLERGGGAQRARISAAHEGCVTRLRWTRTLCFASVGVDGALREWDCRTAQCRSEHPNGHTDAILDAVAPKPLQTQSQPVHVVSASDDASVRAYKLP